MHVGIEYPGSIHRGYDLEATSTRRPADCCKDRQLNEMMEKGRMDGLHCAEGMKMALKSGGEEGTMNNTSG